MICGELDILSILRELLIEFLIELITRNLKSPGMARDIKWQMTKQKLKR